MREPANKHIDGRKPTRISMIARMKKGAFSLVRPWTLRRVTAPLGADTLLHSIYPGRCPPRELGADDA